VAARGVARQKPRKTILRTVGGLLLRIDDGETEAVGERRPTGAVVKLVCGLCAAVQRDDQWRLRRQVSGSVNEHAEVAGICAEPGQFSQPCRAGRRYADASRPLSGRFKKTFEFASKRLKTGKNLAWIAHREQTVLQRNNIYCALHHRGPWGWSQDFSESNPDGPKIPLRVSWRGETNVRFGSKADIDARPTDVRFTAKSGHAPHGLYKYTRTDQDACDPQTGEQVGS
jgi:hypothetical protein